MMLNLHNNMLAINRTKIIIEILHNVRAICMQYFSKYYSNFIFCGHRNIATILQQCFYEYIAIFQNNIAAILLL